MNQAAGNRVSLPVTIAFAASLGCASEPTDAPGIGETEPATTSSSSATSSGAQGTETAPMSSGTSDASEGSGTTGDPEPGTDGSTGSDTEGEGSPPEGTVPAFVALGHMGRTMVSCDDGRTWVANQSLDEDTRCFEPTDCDHHEGSATGITFGDGVFVATWGWGADGQIQTSEDGVEWTTVLTGPTFAGSAWGDGVFLTAAKFPYRATGLAQRWNELPDSGLEEWTPRGIGFAPAGGGRFILGGGGGASGDVVVTADGGDTWMPAVGADACGASIRDIVGGQDSIVIATGGSASTATCVSQDAGATFTTVDLPERLEALLWASDEFVGFGPDARYTSDDGQQWEATPYAKGTPRLTAIARSSDGTYVAQRDGWLVWYEDQALFRSGDGVSWEELPSDAFVQSHPIRHVAFGYVQPSATGCTLP
ncbi:MAG: hypothetical protein KUG77_14445 [Nannocystaceae bacterium]|nr:hypothetical protein [Nannocystaceae bacterium]